jgi:hypothetical protein
MSKNPVTLSYTPFSELVRFYINLLGGDSSASTHRKHWPPWFAWQIIRHLFLNVSVEFCILFGHRFSEVLSLLKQTKRAHDHLLSKVW